MANKIGLSDVQQAWLVFLAALLLTWGPVLSVWLNEGMPTDRLALGALFAGLLLGFVGALILFMKEYLGITVPSASTVPPP
jgi:TRAP-type C4-dicarboxylate transport system permease small subunit